MPIVGFNFKKIDVERKDIAKGKINISNNVTVKEVSKRDISFSKNQGGCNFEFEFISKYEPEIGIIKLNGEVIYMDTDKKITEIIDNWKKEKKIDKDLMAQILNNVLMKCNIQALILSQEINLPPPIPLPKVELGKAGAQQKVEK